MAPFAPAAYPGTLHHYTERLSAFEHEFKAGVATHNTILFLGGLGDGLLHPTYPALLAKRLPPGGSVAELLLSSSYSGWATATLKRDADEVAAAVTYFRALPGRGAAKIVLVGHSTGCQISLEYLVGPRNDAEIPAETRARPPVDGVVLQAGISDRDALTALLLGQPKAQEGVKLARQLAADGRGDEQLPAWATSSVFGANPTAYRWLSFVDKHGDDDYFSADLADADHDRTFGQVRVPLCVLLGAADPYMPEHVDKAALVARYRAAAERGGGVWSGESGVVPDMSHNGNDSSEAAREALVQRIVNFAAAL